jgi:LPXTG-site transpeptidase (sortase) family protein
MGDVVRFGATFATIFGVLFVGLNYQSFSSIIAAQIDPLSAAEDAGKLSRMLAVDAPDADVAVARAGDLFSLVPPVGPPENRLVIPKLNLNIPIVIPSNTALIDENWTALEKDIQDGLQHGVVHYPGTARPGQAGNVFITGHSSYYYPGPYTSVFARLAELDPGDEFWLYYGGDKHRYRIIDEREVSPTDVSVLNQPSTIREATLMTCTPVGTTLRRLVVRAQEIDVITGEVLAVGEHGQQPDLPEMKMEMLPI